MLDTIMPGVELRAARKGITYMYEDDSRDGLFDSRCGFFDSDDLFVEASGPSSYFSSFCACHSKFDFGMHFHGYPSCLS